MQTDISRCDFLVDLSLPDTTATSPLEPDYALDKSKWEIIECLPFLDAARTPTLARIIWVPDLPFLPRSVRRVWGNYYLLRQRKELL